MAAVSASAAADTAAHTASPATTAAVPTPTAGSIRSPATLSSEAVRRILAAACAAPSGHNTQPWAFEVHADRIVVHLESSRLLPVADPHRWESAISIGCCVEGAVLAAQCEGYSCQVDSTVSGKATIHFFRAATEDTAAALDAGLAAEIPRRHVHRGLYDADVPIDPSILAALEDVHPAAEIKGPARVCMWVDYERVSEFVEELLRQANAAQFQDAAWKAELASWMRFNATEAKEKRTGLFGPSVGAPSLPGWLGRLVMPWVATAASQTSTDVAALASSRGVAVIATTGDGWAELIAAGRLCMRWMLQATRLGVQFAVLNGVIQVNETRAQLQQLVHAFMTARAGETSDESGPIQWRPHMLLRFGCVRSARQHDATTPPSFRLPVESCILPTSTMAGLAFPK